MVRDNNNVLKTGTFVHIVIERNERKELVEVRSSSIHAFSGSTLALAQTAPPLDSSYLGRTMLVTIVSNEGGKRVRYGFKADLERTEECCLPSGKKQRLLIFAMRSDMHLDNLRFFYRVHVPKDLIWADIDNQTVTLPIYRTEASEPHGAPINRCSRRIECASGSGWHAPNSTSRLRCGG